MMEAALIIKPDDLERLLKRAAEAGADIALSRYNPMPDEKYLTTCQCADILHCSIRTVQERIRNGELRASKRGRSFFVNKKDLEKYLRG